jgi:hypothetical protein
MYAVGVAAFSLIALIAGLGSANSNRGIALILGIVSLPFAILLVLATIPTFRPIAIANDNLRIPRIISSTKIPLMEISGVGLLFKKEMPGTKRSSGWYLYVWRGDESLVRLGTSEFIPKRWVKPHDPNGRSHRFVMKGSMDEIRSTDPAILAESKLGKMAKRIFDEVLRTQGGSGVLAVRQLQRHPHLSLSQGTSLTAYWSPDGEIGRI